MRGHFNLSNEFWRNFFEKNNHDVGTARILCKNQNQVVPKLCNISDSEHDRCKINNLCILVVITVNHAVCR